MNIFQLSIIEVDNAPITPIVLSDIQSTTLNLPGDPNVGVWNLSSSFDLDQALANAGESYNHGATKLVARINNTLTALSQPGSVAGIFKKDFDIDPETRVPEPTTFALAAVWASRVVGPKSDVVVRKRNQTKRGPSPDDGLFFCALTFRLALNS